MHSRLAIGPRIFALLCEVNIHPFPSAVKRTGTDMQFDPYLRLSWGLTLVHHRRDGAGDAGAGSISARNGTLHAACILPAVAKRPKLSVGFGDTQNQLVAMRPHKVINIARRGKLRA